MGNELNHTLGEDDGESLCDDLLVLTASPTGILKPFIGKSVGDGDEGGFELPSTFLGGRPEGEKKKYKQLLN